jgi:hypothetical protein
VSFFKFFIVGTPGLTRVITRHVYIIYVQLPGRHVPHAFIFRSCSLSFNFQAYQVFAYSLTVFAYSLIHSFAYSLSLIRLFALAHSLIRSFRPLQQHHSLDILFQWPFTFHYFLSFWITVLGCGKEHPFQIILQT